MCWTFEAKDSRFSKSLAFQWFGGSQKTIPTIATFVLSIWQELTKRNVLKYSNLPSALQPVGHCDEIPRPVFKELPDVDSKNLDVNFEEQGDLNDNDFVLKSSEPILLNQEELGDLIRDLDLSKEWIA